MFNESSAFDGLFDVNFVVENSFIVEESALQPVV
jgi:hypothetical protein